MPTGLGTLDASHLVTALEVIESRHIQLAFLTNDDQLALAAHVDGAGRFGRAQLNWGLVSQRFEPSHEKSFT